jgi:hypothetical protein
MDWQLAAVAPIVLAAVAYLARGTLRSWSARKSACGGCGTACHAPSTNGQPLIPLEQLTIRRRPPA